MQKLKKNVSSFRPPRFHRKNGVTQEKDTNATTHSTSPTTQNGIFDGNGDEQRSNDSEDRTLSSETANEAPYTSANDNYHGEGGGGNGVNIRRATRARRNTIITASICFFISVIFLILVSLIPQKPTFSIKSRN